MIEFGVFYEGRTTVNEVAIINGTRIFPVGPTSFMFANFQVSSDGRTMRVRLKAGDRIDHLSTPVTIQIAGDYQFPTVEGLTSV